MTTFTEEDFVILQRYSDIRQRTKNTEIAFIFSHPEIEWDNFILTSRMIGETKKADLKFILSHPEMKWNIPIVRKRVLFSKEIYNIDCFDFSRIVDLEFVLNTIPEVNWDLDIISDRVLDEVEEIPWNLIKKKPCLLPLFYGRHDLSIKDIAIHLPNELRKSLFSKLCKNPRICLEIYEIIETGDYKFWNEKTFKNISSHLPSIEELRKRCRLFLSKNLDLKRLRIFLNGETFIEEKIPTPDQEKLISKLQDTRNVSEFEKIIRMLYFEKFTFEELKSRITNPLIGSFIIPEMKEIIEGKRKVSILNLTNSICKMEMLLKRGSRIDRLRKSSIDKIKNWWTTLIWNPRTKIGRKRTLRSYYTS